LSGPWLQAILTELFQAGRTVFLFAVRCQATFYDSDINWNFLNVTGFILPSRLSESIEKHRASILMNAITKRRRQTAQAAYAIQNSQSFCREPFPFYPTCPSTGFYGLTRLTIEII
jgi:hypothetical protein